MDAIVSPLDDATKSLLMNRPVGWLHLTPFGAVRSTEGGAMLSEVLYRASNERDYCKEGRRGYFMADNMRKANPTTYYLAERAAPL